MLLNSDYYIITVFTHCCEYKEGDNNKVMEFLHYTTISKEPRLVQFQTLSIASNLQKKIHVREFKRKQVAKMLSNLTFTAFKSGCFVFTASQSERDIMSSVQNMICSMNPKSGKKGKKRNSSS